MMWLSAGERILMIIMISRFDTIRTDALDRRRTDTYQQHALRYAQWQTTQSLL